MKKLIFAVLFGAMLIGFMNTRASAATKMASMEAELYVKQSKQLNIFYNGEAVSPKDVSWKVTSGSAYAKIGKDGIVTGKKAGKAVITGTYKGGYIEYNITVSKAPKAKAKSYKINGLTLKMPKGLVKSKAQSTDELTVLESIKDETMVTISVLNKDDYAPYSDKQILDYLRDNIKQSITAAEGTVNNGFTITKSEVVKDEDLKNGFNIFGKETIKTERPVYVTSVVAIKSNKIMYITISSNSSDREKSIAKSIISKNKLGK